MIIDGTQATYCKIYSDVDLPLRRAQANIQILGSCPRFGVEAVAMVLIAFLAFALAGRSTNIAGAIPIIGALALSAQRLLPLMQQIYSSWASMRGGRDTLQDALELLEQPLPAHAHGSLPNSLGFNNRITIKNLSFRYTMQSPWVLRGVSLTIPKGCCVGFIGSTGSGKSTLLDVVMGLLQPTEGSLVIDDVTLTPENYRSWQTHIAHVPQAIFLADSTVAENIAFGVPSELIDHSRVREVAIKAQIAQTIESWDRKYSTLVGERGVRLSGGQRQRIGIARALYKQADVIVFDEATSALDSGTECAVMQAIECLGDDITVLIVAHRLTTLKKCSKVVELQEGEIKREGTYVEVVGQISG
jgi:ATP-binding cassette subfamily B protein